MSSDQEVVLQTITEPTLGDEGHDCESLLVNNSYKYTTKDQNYTLSSWLEWIVSTRKEQPDHCNTWPLSHIKIVFQGLKRALWGLVIVLGLLSAASLCWREVVFLFPNDLDYRLDAWDFSSSRLSIFSHWTTDGTPISKCHSQNDYWQKVPLYSALRAGCISVGVDLWLADGDLVVSHDPPGREHKVTLDTLYLKPLLWMLQQHNTGSGQPDKRGQDGIPVAGVFSNDPSQTMTLVLDFKSNGDELLPYVMSHLQPLRDAGYLTYFDGRNVTQRPITVVASGNIHLHKITSNQTYRDIFFDAPLDKLETILSTDQQTSIHYNTSDSYYASVDFSKTVGELRRNQFSQKQLALIRNQIRTAHKHGLQARYTGTPTWPRGLRNHVWHILVREGVDIIDMEDLREGTRQDWRKHQSWLL